MHPLGLLQAPSVLNLPLSKKWSRALPLRGWIFLTGAQHSSVSYREELRLMLVAGEVLDSCGEHHTSRVDCSDSLNQHLVPRHYFHVPPDPTVMLSHIVFRKEVTCREPS